MIAGFEVAVEARYHGGGDDISLMRRDIENAVTQAINDMGYEVDYVDARNTFIEAEDGDDNEEV